MSEEGLTNCRGVSSWMDDQNTDGVCSHRIITGTLDGRLIALDGQTGKPCESFGTNGEIDLAEGLTDHESFEYNSSAGYQKIPAVELADAFD